MSVIKNKAKLVERAKGHKRQDQVARNTYLEILDAEDDDVTFTACAIGCLATGCSIKEIQEEYGEFSVSIDETTGTYAAKIDDDVLVDKLESDFGICYKLARLAEAIFEGIVVGGDPYFEEDYFLKGNAYYNWPTRFAEALPEGVDITDEMVIDFAESAGFDIEINTEIPDGSDDRVIEWLESLS